MEGWLIASTGFMPTLALARKITPFELPFLKVCPPDLASEPVEVEGDVGAVSDGCLVSARAFCRRC